MANQRRPRDHQNHTNIWVLFEESTRPTSSSEGELGHRPSMSNQQESSPKSKYWDEELPDKCHRKPNPKYANHLSTSKVRIGDLNQAVLMGLDWKQNQQQPVSTNYSKLMALLQLATDPFTHEIDGDLHPCLLASKASQADNPTYEEVMNSPHRDGFLQAMKKELSTLEEMNCWKVVERIPGSTFYRAHGRSRLKEIQTGACQSTKPASVLVVIGKSKELIFLKHLHQW
jgi:hypothetical protein